MCASASIAGLLITTEAMVAKLPKKDVMPTGHPHPPHGGRHGLLSMSASHNRHRRGSWITTDGQSVRRRLSRDVGALTSPCEHAPKWASVLKEVLPRLLLVHVGTRRLAWCKRPRQRVSLAVLC